MSEVTQEDMLAAATANDYATWDAFWHGAGNAYAQKQARAFARHRITAIAAYLAQREADGFVMVPVEPTEAMMGAGCTVPCDEVLSGSVLYNTPEEARAIHRAMIAARPKGGVK